MGLLLDVWNLIEQILPDGWAQFVVLLIFGVLIYVSINRQNEIKAKDATIESLKQELNLVRMRSPEELEKMAKGVIFFHKNRMKIMEEELNESRAELARVNSQLQTLKEQSEIDSQRVEGLEVQRRELIGIIESRDKQIGELRTVPNQQLEKIIQNYGYYLSLAGKAAQFGTAGSGYAMHLIKKEIGTEAAQLFTKFALDVYFPDLINQPEVQDFLAQYQPPYEEVENNNW